MKYQNPHFHVQNADIQQTKQNFILYHCLLCYLTSVQYKNPHGICVIRRAIFAEQKSESLYPDGKNLKKYVSSVGDK